MNTLFERNIANYKDEWLTPPSIIKSLGEFDLDPCSPVGRPFDTASKHFTIEDNGLVQTWNGRVWCNPPYSDIEQWVRKCAHHGDASVLVFARTETEWFFRYVWNKADSIMFLAKRIKFHHISGAVAKGNAGAPSVIIAYGKNNVDQLQESGLQGKHLHLTYTPMIIVGISPTWVSVVSIAVRHYGDDELKPLYEMVERIAPDKVLKNQHWKAKVRQSIQVIRKQKSA